MDSKILLISGIVAVIAISVWIAKKNENKDIKEDTIATVLDTVPDAPVAFGYKCMWFAVKTEDKDRVAKVLNLKNTKPSNWKSGIEQAYNASVFVTPSIDGWVLVAGWGLPHGDSQESLAEVKTIAGMLSKEFDEAHFFCSHRVVEYHCWLKSVNGNTQRLYSYMGEQLQNIEIVGKPTDAEKGYDLVNTFSAEAEKDDYWDNEDLIIPDEQLVMKIAGAWSIDPTLIENNKNIKGLGLLGTLK